MNKWPHDRTEAKREELLLDYLESRLEPEVATQLEKHLAICRECRSMLEDNRAFTVFRESMLERCRSATPTDEFANRLKQQIKNETNLPAKTSRLTRAAWLIALPRYSRLAAAAILVILIGSGGLLTYRFLPQNRLMSNKALDEASIQSPGLMSAEAGLPGSESANSGMRAAAAADQGSGTSNDPSGTNASDTSVAGESPMNTTAEALLMSKAAPVQIWRDAWAENLSLPLMDKTNPEQPVLTQILFDKAKSVVLIEPDVLLVAYPARETEGQLDRLNKLKLDYDPGYRVESIEESSMQKFLTDRLGSSETIQILNTIVQKDCGYLIMTIGGN